MNCVMSKIINLTYINTNFPVVRKCNKFPMGM